MCGVLKTVSSLQLTALVAAVLVLAGCEAASEGSAGGESGGTTVGGGSGIATLSWTPPTRSAGGSALTDLAGYEIHYGTSPGDYTDVIVVVDPNVTSYVVDDLAASTYYFAMTAFDLYGNVSAFSNMVSKEVTN